MRRSHLSIAATIVAVTTAGEPAHAQRCDRPDLLDTIPADGATDVPLNAQLLARYDSRAEYLDEPVLFGKAGTELDELGAVFDENEGLVELIPPVPLEPGERYQIEWPQLRGVNTASLGRGAKVEFTAGDAEDVEPPRFEGAAGVTWEVDHQRDDCTDLTNERLRFHVDLAPATDDGGRELLTLILFQTKGPDIDETAAATPIQVRAMPEGNRTDVRLGVDEAVGEVCFAAIVRDSAGFVSSSGSQEVCTKTRRPPFFQGCGVAQVARPRSGAWWTALAGLALALVTSRRARRTRRALQ
jgi:hypothetical protein